MFVTVEIRLYLTSRNSYTYHQFFSVLQCVGLSACVRAEPFRAVASLQERLTPEPFEQGRFPNSVVTQEDHFVVSPPL